MTNFRGRVVRCVVGLGGTPVGNEVIIDTPAGALVVTTQLDAVLARFKEHKRANILFQDERWKDSPNLFTGEWAFQEATAVVTLARFEQRLAWLLRQKKSPLKHGPE